MSSSGHELTPRHTDITPFGPNTMNRAGGLAFQDTPRMALYRQVATSLWSGDGYYERKSEWFGRFQQNVASALNEERRFPFALAAYARDRRGLALRTSPLALYVEAASHPLAKGSSLIRRYAPRVIRRADEPGEAIAYYRKHHKGAIPNGLRRGIADVLRGFDEYELGKYKGGDVALRDVLRIARPKPANDDERALWNRTVKHELATPYTWEVELSRATTDGEKRAVWNELIHSGKLGLFALVRNLRNIIKINADIEEALSRITPEAVARAGILPFQWYKAYKAIAEANNPTIAKVMEQAVEWSLAGVPKLPGITLVVCDNSHSMTSVSATRGMSNAELGNLMGAMAVYCCESGMGSTFGETFELAQTSQQYSLFRNKLLIDQCGANTGHETNAWRIFETLIHDRVYVDRVILFSDMQCYDGGARYTAGYAGHSLSGELEAYQRLNPSVVVYSVNLATQDNSCQFAPDQPVAELAGFSESIFQFMAAMEAGQDILTLITERY